MGRMPKNLPQVWEERKDDRFLLAALNGAKRNENETLEEFNRRFDQTV
jgi:hypothetical protein